MDQSTNGLRIVRVRVPIGVIASIFESRPNVIIDVAALCVKSGNAVIERRQRGTTFKQRTHSMHHKGA